MPPRSRVLLSRLAAAAFAALVSLPAAAGAQTFVEVTDPANPIVSDTGVNPASYSGASWIDYNDDGRLDLFVVRRNVYRNDGGGVFTKLAPGVAAQGAASGNSWADADNDGDLDLFTAAGLGGTISKGSFFYRNDGADVFTKVTTGTLGDTLANSGWGAVWGDYDNDGLADLLISAAFNFGGVTHPNRLYHNDGGGAFTRITTTDVTDTTAPFTIPMFADYDDDGDFDIFIGSGPANGTVAPDYIYRNMLVENGAADFVRLTAPNFASDPRDGQNFNLIDYDNDTDLDIYVTNYAGTTGGLANDLYRNDGGGAYTKMTAGDAGAIVGDADVSLGNIWVDFDNDGDLDCYVTNDGVATCRYYQNDGDGTFTAIVAGAFVAEPGPHYCATAGDYDDDGDMDIFVSGAGTSKSLYRNDIGNTNAWAQVKCVGVQSNRAAIGTKLRAIATIGGSRVEQRRDIGAQTGFNGHDSFIAHFGLLDAAVIDSLVVTWPLGLTEIYTGLAVNQKHTFVEGASVVGVGHGAAGAPPLRLGANQPNPFTDATAIDLRLDRAESVRLEVFDVSGRRVATLVDGRLGAGEHTLRFAPDGAAASGTFLYRVTAGRYQSTRKMTFVR